MIETPPLSNYSEFRVSCHCDRCRVQDQRTVMEIIDELGEIAVDELTSAMAMRLGCDRDPEADRHACELEVLVVPPPISKDPMIMVPQILRRWKATKAPDDLRLGDLQEWDSIYAFCRCGHARWLSHKDLRKQFGPEMMLGDLRPRLRCQGNETHREVGFAISRDPR